MNRVSVPIKILVIGAGNRGNTYSDYALSFPDKVQIAAIAEPDQTRAADFAAKHSLPPESVFCDWKDAAASEKIADAVIIATQDTLHVEPTVAFAKKGYHILLEKPMATHEADCKTIAAAVKEADLLFAVCHVLRYTPYTQTLKEIVDSGTIGEIVSIDHIEPVGYWHFAHSFVRGNWRNSDESTFFLLAKSCHDIDWLQYIVGEKATKVSSMGSLTYFTKENKPTGAADRCTECTLESKCPYSAVKIYSSRAEKQDFDWPVSTITSVLTEGGVRDAIEQGPYGRCVYSCNNNVCDHQVVMLEYENGTTASFTVTAFTEHKSRMTKIFGTKGAIETDGKKLMVFDFLSDTTGEVDISKTKNRLLSGHGGGDMAIMEAFVSAVSQNDASYLISGVDETLTSHLTVFAAEKSRLENKMYEL